MAPSFCLEVPPTSPLNGFLAATISQASELLARPQLQLGGARLYHARLFSLRALVPPLPPRQRLVRLIFCIYFTNEGARARARASWRSEPRSILGSSPRTQSSAINTANRQASQLACVLGLSSGTRMASRQIVSGEPRRYATSLRFVVNSNSINAQIATLLGKSSRVSARSAASSVERHFAKRQPPISNDITSFGLARVQAPGQKREPPRRAVRLASGTETGPELLLLPPSCESFAYRNLCFARERLSCPLLGPLRKFSARQT